MDGKVNVIFLPAADITISCQSIYTILSTDFGVCASSHFLSHTTKPTLGSFTPHLPSYFVQNSQIVRQVITTIKEKEEEREKNHRTNHKICLNMNFDKGNWCRSYRQSCDKNKTFVQNRATGESPGNNERGQENQIFAAGCFLATCIRFSFSGCLVGPIYIHSHSQIVTERTGRKESKLPLNA